MRLSSTPKIYVILSAIWLLLSLPLTVQISDNYEDDTLSTLFYYFCVSSPVWGSLLWKWSEDELGKLNHAVIPLYFVTCIITLISIGSHRYREEIQHIPAITLLAFLVLSYVLKTKALLKLQGLVETYYIPLLFALVIFIGLVMTAVKYERVSHHENSPNTYSNSSVVQEYAKDVSPKALIPNMTDKEKKAMATHTKKETVRVLQPWEEPFAAQLNEKADEAKKNITSPSD